MPHIRPATSQDLPRLIEVSLASFGEVTWQRAVDRLFGPLNGQDWRARWRRRVEKAFHEQQVLALVEGGEILGYACGTIDAALGLAHLDILAVDPAAQGRGYGRQLLLAFEQHALREGASHLTLESLVDNETANAMYRRHGYRSLAQHHNWFKKLGPG